MFESNRIDGGNPHGPVRCTERVGRASLTIAAIACLFAAAAVMAPAVAADVDPPWTDPYTGLTLDLHRDVPASGDTPEWIDGAACSGPLWSNFAYCPLKKITATVSGGVNATTAGTLSVERPTLISLGIDWWIGGDENRNANVEMVYRRKGETNWHKALPPLRLQGEKIATDPTWGSPPLKYVIPNMFSGSLFDLQPDTDYEIKLTLTDPDGVSGEAVRTVYAHTRAEPRDPGGGKVYHVYPWGYKGPRQQPAFTGLNAAYYIEGGRHADWSNVSAPRVQPGDVILDHAGTYKDTPTLYGVWEDHPTLGAPFDGTLYLTQSGTPEKPIVIKAAGDGEVIFDGGGNFNLFNLLAANYNYFEGITVRNTEIAFLVGEKNIIGASGFTLEHCRIEDVGRGVYDDWGGSKDFYIADNVFVGRHDPDKLLGWIPGGPFSRLPGFPERLSGPGGSEYAIKIYGQGHVVAYNRVERFHDGIDVASYADPDGAPDELPARIPVSIDFYNNDIFNMGDNCIEADGGARNIRVFRNRCFNSAGGALSAQPLFGGPLYFIRNVVVQAIGTPLKYSIMPAGVINYHNTYLSQNNETNDASNVHFRNNLMLSHGSREPAGGSGSANAGSGREATPSFSVNTFTTYSSSDYNGFRNGDGVAQPFAWNSPPEGIRTLYGGGPPSKICGRGPYGCNKAPSTPLVHRSFKSLAQYAAATGQDRHSVMVDYDVFVRAQPPNLPDVQHLYQPDDYDLTLRKGAKAIDAGVVLPNIDDGYTGRAPDLGAYEYSQPVPHYGPRP
jgi:hypothetical protein